MVEEPGREGTSVESHARGRNHQKSPHWLWQLRNWLWGYDFFISYHWDSGGVYATALAERLRDQGFDVFLDRAEFAAGDDWKEEARHALRHTQRLIVVGTYEAVTESEPVASEVEAFSERRRQIILITFGNTLTEINRAANPVLKHLSETELFVREDPASLPSGPPDTADGVLRTITRTHAILRRRQLRSRIVIGVITSLTLAIITVASFWQLAEARRRLAEHRQRIADSRRLAALSVSERSNRFDRSLLLAVEALRAEDTLEARESLYNGLRDRPGLSAFLHVDEGRVSSVAFSPDDRILASGYSSTEGGGVVLWDIAHAKRLMEAALRVEEGSVRAVSFSPDGKILAAGFSRTVAETGANYGGVVLWDLDTNKRLTEEPLRVDGSLVSSVAFTLDSKLLAAGYSGRDGRGGVQLWDMVGPKPSATRFPTMKGGRIHSVAFSPDGKTLAVGHGDRSGGVVLWDVQTSRPVAGDHPKLKDAGVVSIAFSPDGRTLVAGYNRIQHSSGILLWDLVAHKCLSDTPHISRILGTVFSSDSKTLAVADAAGTVTLRDASDQKPTLQVPPVVKEGAISSVAFSRGQQTIAIGYVSNNSISGVALREMTTVSRVIDELTPTNKNNSWRASVSFSPGGDVLASAHSFLGNSIAALALWDLSAHKLTEERPLLARHIIVGGAAYSPDGKHIAVGYYSEQGDIGGVQLWDVATHNALPDQPFVTKEGLITSVRFSPDSRRLAAGYTEVGNTIQGGVLFWDVATHERLPPLNVKEGAVSSIAFSPDGKVIAAGYHRRPEALGGVVARYVDTCKPFGDATLVVNEGGVSSIAFSPNGKVVAIGYHGTPGGVLLWDLSSRRRLTVDPLRVSFASVRSVAFSPDGATLAAGCGSNSNRGGGVTLWDVSSRERVLSDFVTSDAEVLSLAFSPNGKTLAAGLEGRVALCDVDLESWQHKAALLANRNFTREEWHRFFRDEPYRATFPELLVTSK